jgi:hypothetical protein
MVTALFSFVPLVGTAIVWLPAAIILIVIGHPVKGLILLAWGGGVVSMVDNIVRPLVISGQMRFHPLYVFFALLGGVQAFGFIGLFVGPAVLALAYSLFSVVREENQTEPAAPLSSRVIGQRSRSFSLPLRKDRNDLPCPLESGLSPRPPHLQSARSGQRDAGRKGQ